MLTIDNLLREYKRLINIDASTKEDIEYVQERFNNLSEENKQRLLTDLLNEFIGYCTVFYGNLDFEKSMAESERLETICASEGHDFTDWEKIISPVSIWKNNRFGQGVVIKNKTSIKYERICKRCGNKEYSDKKPDDFIENRPNKIRK